MLIKIEAIVREEKFEQVKSALQDIQVNGVTISQVMGYGTQRGYTEIVRGSEVDILLHPKIKWSSLPKNGNKKQSQHYKKPLLPAKSVTEKFSAMKSAALSKSAQKRPVIMQFSHKIIFNLPGNHSSICDFPVSLFQHDPVCTKGTH